MGVVLQCIVVNDISAQITKYEYIETRSFGLPQNIVIYVDASKSKVIVHFENGMFGTNNIDYSLYCFKDSTVTDINSIAQTGIMSKSKLESKYVEESDFDTFLLREDTIFATQTVSKYNPFAIGDSVVLRHTAKFINRNIDSDRICIPYVNATIGGYSYIISLQKTAQIESDFTSYGFERKLISVSEVDTMPNLKYCVVEDYKDVIK